MNIKYSPTARQQRFRTHTMRPPCAGIMKANPVMTRRLFDLLDLGIEGEADLASYLLFDGPFCRRLIELGRADAQARRDELIEFFREVQAPDSNRPEPPDDREPLPFVGR